MAIPIITLEAAKARLQRNPSAYLGDLDTYAGLTVRPVQTCPDTEEGTLSGVRVCRPSDAEAWGLYLLRRADNDGHPPGATYHEWLEDFATMRDAWSFLRAVASHVAHEAERFAPATTLAAHP